MKAFENWGGNIRWRAEQAKPDDLDEVRELIVDRDKLTVAGHGHSFSGIVRSEGVTMRTRDIPAVVRRGDWDADVDATRVIVDGQIAVGDAYARMDRLGVAVPNSGSSAYPSVIGAAATAVHGSGWRWGSLSHQDSLRAIRGIDGRGAAFQLDARTPSDAADLRALRAHLGGCGFIRGVELATIPSYRVHSYDRLGTLGDALKEAEQAAIRAHGSHLPERYEAFWFPGITEESDPMDGTAMQAWRATTTRPADRGAVPAGFIRDVIQGNAAIEGILIAGKLARLAGDDDGTLLRFGWRGLLAAASRQQVSEGLVERWDLGLTGPRLFTGVSMEYALEPRHLKSALSALHGVVERWSNNGWYTLDLPINLRWTGGDEGVCMSAAHRGPTAWVDITVSEHGRRAAYGPFLYACERVLVEHGGLPHLGKAHWISPKSRWDAELWESFWSIRARYDPDERFLNAHLAALRDGLDLDVGLPKTLSGD